MDLTTLTFDSAGLIPGIVQDRAGEVRMVAWLNREALQRTLDTGFVTFWSRSRQALWVKGESSGNRLKLVQIRPDCDSDALLILAEPEGPSCHRGTRSCFDDPSEGGQAAGPWPVTLPWLGRLEALLASRKAAADLKGSYTQKLFAQGVDRIAKKVVEEAGEVVIAAKNDDREEFLGEAADLLFHLDMLLLERGASLLDVVEVLQKRHADRTGGPA
ncbi:MAG TPA: bifunctional phosphoribosyl-AMP cyclohydrolase/phosphoribosyl-ATP diphosphatase HisIE [Geothrix sp.]|jgi:phosphoribosyl-ATP pyrophosphohydrolase/phosphoribosyl-AMP cyclohydrolase